MKYFLLIGLLSFLFSIGLAQADTTGFQKDTFVTKSKALKKNKLDLNLNRNISVWLPPGYSNSKKRYPVIYYIHNYAWSAGQMEEIENFDEALYRGFERDQIDEFIFVVGDFTSTLTPGTFCGNNDVVGHWWDYISKELVEAVDQRYRTLAKPESRGLSGDYIGGYCAIRVAMERPGVFSSVYAIHPVGTGLGEGTMHSAPDWNLLHKANSYADLKDASGYTRAFLLMAQSHAPNLSKPPFYADFMMDIEGEELVLKPQVITNIRRNFLLGEVLADHIEEMKSLTALMFDWGRDDRVRGHVRGNRTFTKLLDEYGIEHQAEEHRGNEWSEKWIPRGRVEDRMLPFFNRYLEFK